MFEKELKIIERRLKVPYPERTAFVAELRADLTHASELFRASGLSADEARQRALDTLSLTDEDVDDLNEVHEALALRAIRRLPQPVARAIEDFGGIVPLIAFVSIMTKEVPMVEFLREGGIPFVVTILIVGGFGLAIELQRAFRWFVLRDHSEQSLAPVSSGPLYLAAAAFMIGVISTAEGYRIVFSKWAQGEISDPVFRAGLAEPLAALIVASAAAVLIVMLHGWMASWRERTVAGLERRSPRD